jgi:hypothetical protein
VSLRSKLAHPNALVAIVLLTLAAAALMLAVAGQWFALAALGIVYAVLLLLVAPR